MLLIEKVLILRSSEIFENTPENELVEIAAILQEVYLDAQTNLFLKGDIGNCMFFIFKGKVRIHDGNHTLALLGENEIVGELSVLDAENRSASATTTEDCILLKLEQEPFYETLINNAGILKGILKTLCKRIRAINQKSITLAQSN